MEFANRAGAQFELWSRRIRENDGTLELVRRARGNGVGTIEVAFINMKFNAIQY